MSATRRLQKELLKLQEHLPPGISLVQADNFETWLMDIKVLDDNPLYRGDTYRLKFHFSSSYPIEAPEVTFITSPTTPKIPMHPHVYSNGIICLDLLDRQGWSPVHNVESVCMSLQSMLTGNEKNERPPGDADFVKSNRRRPRDISFYFHDEKV
ncbi:ubiquitin conjugating enzyme [Rhizodiscina lignyota]|uniref:Ubiquitin conjugating enzyme n=1 Tax=Rhizodiscina lignyota TaxID=1504668 RepID=A0A9P4M656_9PEZI|nr:ubiquitin conjugating enzyme [Rhizodiscina lignyota]